VANVRDKVIAQLKRNARTKGAFESVEEAVGLPSGCLAVDVITGIGGLPVGRITEILGWEASGKSTLAMSMCVEATKAGLYWAYIDAEQAINPLHAKRLGFVHDDEAVGLYARPQSYEAAMDMVEKLTNTGEIPLIIVDSIPALVPESELEGDIEKSVVGSRARLASNIIPKLNDAITANGVTLVLLNQMRAKIQTGWSPGPPRKEDTEQSTGGNALKFYASLRLEMKLTKKGSESALIADLFNPGKDVKVATASTHVAKAIKNKVGPPYREATFLIRYDEKATPPLFGIDNLYTAVSIGIVHGLVDKGAGGKFTYHNGSKSLSVVGEDQFLLRLREEPTVALDLLSHVAAIPEVSSILSKRRT
jgi:recombination protein RecA